MNIFSKISILFAATMLPASLVAQAVAPAAPTATPKAEATVQANSAPLAQAPVVQTPATPASPVIAPGDAAAPVANKVEDKGSYTPTDATKADIVGKPVADSIDLQTQHNEIGQDIYWLNNVLLLPIITAISLFVLALLIWIAVRYNYRANPVPSKTTHNTLLEVLWTAVPVLILVVIAVPSLGLIAKQFKPAPEDAVTVKVTGNQWNWTYTYPDHGGIEMTSNMLKEKSEVGKDERARTDADGPKLLAVDNRMVVPAGVPLRMQITAADVIHSFAIPSLGFKLDAVPGRLNEKQLIIPKPGVYFGQCSELCGAQHAFMPIAVEAVPPAQYAAWIKFKGGKMPAEIKAEADAKAAADKAAAVKATADAAAKTNTDAAAKAASAPADKAAPAAEEKAAPVAATN